MAHEWFLKATQQELVSAQIEVGLMYYKGQGVPQDQAISFQWCFKAAQREFAQAMTDAAINGRPNVQSELGFMYYEGHEIPQDYQVAFEWFSKVAEQDHGLAQAMEKLLKPANQGRPSAQYDLGAMFFNGYGVGQNFSVAFEWFLKSVNCLTLATRSMLIENVYGSNLESIRPHLQAIRPIHSRSKVLPHLKGSGIKPMEPRKIAAVHNAVMDVVVVDNLLTYTEPVPRTQEALYVATTLPGATHRDLPDDKISGALVISSTTRTSITARLPTLYQLQDAMAAINNKLAIQAMIPTGLGDKVMDDGSSMVGDLLSYGEGGTEFDFSSAVKWYRRAADQDDPQGQYYVAKM
ncbi:MAG: hypothetical protein J3R72DRAFT_530162 [Linnemannia gamsii]|nr:MAG: hypothetical protein J3R72DRAFT_530162 [Linnemannia gamsii]